MGKQQNRSRGIQRANENRERQERREAQRNRERHGERRGKDTDGAGRTRRDVDNRDRNPGKSRPGKSGLD